MNEQTLDKLRQLTQIDIQPFWHYISEEITPDSINLDTWNIVTLNDKGYITWPAGRQVQWIGQKIIIPDHLQGYPLTGLTLRLVLTWWAEDVNIFINGQLVQQGDLFDSSTRLLLTPNATPGDEITVTLRLVSPGHDIGGLMAAKLIYERDNGIDPGFVADELTILHRYLETFAPEQLDTFKTTLNNLDWDLVSDAAKFDHTLQNLRQTLQTLAAPLKERSLNLLGHAHLDMAWLWPVNETWEAAQRTFISVLNLQKDYPHLIYCHSTPALYEWIEKHRPDLFKAILDAVKARSWEVLGGMWVEPEVNIISGESLVRQLLYGQNYIKQKFGTITKVAWLPDSFGFCWQLPQIFTQAGIEYFVTGKLHWNDTNKFPYGLFWWQSPDGSRVLTLMSPPNVAGVMDTNPLNMTNYSRDWELQTGLKDAFWLPGVGDHGGGPTRDMLEVAKRWTHSPFFPQINFTTAVDYLSHLNTENAPIWDDELYLELHRGCYTTHADQKAFNRRCEGLLYQAELWSSLATIATKTYLYPKTQIEEAWKKALFNQFHDILPGTSIPEVFTDAIATWTEVVEVTEKLLQKSFKAIASQIILPPLPHPQAKALIIFNSLNWIRSEVVSVPVTSADWTISDLEGKPIPCQLSEGKLLFIAQDIPSIGYRLFWLCPVTKSGKEGDRLTSRFRSIDLAHNGIELEYHNIAPSDSFILENEQLRVIINPITGDISSLFHKTLNREMLKGAGNQLKAYQDQGQYWDAWNIDPNYKQYPLPPTELKAIEYLEQGPIQWRIRVIRQLGNSQFTQDYILEKDSPILKIATKVHWQENHVLVKAAFPLNLESDFATYEIPCGVIKRSTRPQTPTEQAKWEVYALQWADLTDNSGLYGVSILNNCKYGYDSQPDQLCLTLLRSSTWPDPNADRGLHQFTLAIYPHGKTWQDAKTVHKGYELNQPLQVLIFTPPSSLSPYLPPAGQFLDLKGDNLILMALKQSEDAPNSWVLRFYEACGQKTELSLNSDLGLTLSESLDLLENSIKGDNIAKPWQIVTYRLNESRQRD